jgi:hypothetical protein
VEILTSKPSDIIFNISQLYRNIYDKIIEQYNNEKFIDINRIEELFNILRNDRIKLHGLLVSKEIENLNEKAIIKEVRRIYYEKGIILKTAHKIPISIQKDGVKIRYSRYLLTPKNKESADKLKKLENKRGVFPLDMALGVSDLPHNMTVNAMLKVGKVAQASRSYKNASETLAADHGIQLDPATIMTVTNQIGEIAFKNELAQAEESYNRFSSRKTSFSPNRKDGVLYIEINGAFVNAREQSADSNSSFHESKLGLVFSSDCRRVVQKSGSASLRQTPANGLERKRYELTEKNYAAYVGSVDVFKKLMLNCALKGGYGTYKETVVISDGATWIRNLKEELFYDAQKILDYFLLCEKIWSFGKQYFKIKATKSMHNKSQVDEISKADNPKYEKYKEWGDDICLKLLQSKIDVVLNDILEKENKMRLQNNKLSTYIIDNKQSTDYAKYLKQGYDIGSGAIESENKTIIQRRLDGHGMRWRIKSAQNVITLRAKFESGKWHNDVVVPAYKYYDIL